MLGDAGTWVEVTGGVQKENLGQNNFFLEVFRAGVLGAMFCVTFDFADIAEHPGLLLGILQVIPTKISQLPGPRHTPSKSLSNRMYMDLYDNLPLVALRAAAAVWSRSQKTQFEGRASSHPPLVDPTTWSPSCPGIARKRSAVS